MAFVYRPVNAQETPSPEIHKIGDNEVINCTSNHVRIGVWIGKLV